MHGLYSVVEFLAKYTKDKGETNFLGKHVEDKGETTFLDMFQLPKLNDSSITQAPESYSRSPLQQTYPEDHEDMLSLTKAPKMLQSELNPEVNCYGFMTQPARSSKWNQPKRSSELKVMDFINRPFCTKALFATTPKIELHSPTHVRPSLQTTWRLFLGFSRFQQAQERIKQPMDPPDTHQTRRRPNLVLFKGSPGLACFKGLQTYVWRPGDSLSHLETSREVSPCSNTHRIRRILSFKTFHIGRSSILLQQLQDQWPSLLVRFSIYLE